MHIAAKLIDLQKLIMVSRFLMAGVWITLTIDCIIIVMYIIPTPVNVVYC